MVDNNDDCDDTDSLIYPFRNEICDDIDNDCNGRIDEGVLNILISTLMPMVLDRPIQFKRVNLLLVVLKTMMIVMIQQHFDTQ